MGRPGGVIVLSWWEMVRPLSPALEYSALLVCPDMPTDSLAKEMGTAESIKEDGKRQEEVNEKEKAGGKGRQHQKTSKEIRRKIKQGNGTKRHRKQKRH